MERRPDALVLFDARGEKFKVSYVQVLYNDGTRGEPLYLHEYNELYELFECAAPAYKMLMAKAAKLDEL